jgi:cytochrome oxidase Cu insertion factor (SCO1/SenC/PrrC family)
MRRLLFAAFFALGATALGSAGPAPAGAQEPLAVGAEAPDFTLPGATRHGVLAEPVSLSDYEGETVVLAFFFRARTRG